MSYQSDSPYSLTYKDSTDAILVPKSRGWVRVTISVSVLAVCGVGVLLGAQLMMPYSPVVAVVGASISLWLLLALWGIRKPTLPYKLHSDSTRTDVDLVVAILVDDEPLDQVLLTLTSAVAITSHIAIVGGSEAHESFAIDHAVGYVSRASSLRSATGLFPENRFFLLAHAGTILDGNGIAAGSAYLAESNAVAVTGIRVASHIERIFLRRGYEYVRSVASSNGLVLPGATIVRTRILSSIDKNAIINDSAIAEAIAGRKIEHLACVFAEDTVSYTLAQSWRRLLNEQGAVIRSGSSALFSGRRMLSMIASLAAVLRGIPVMLLALAPAAVALSFRPGVPYLAWFMYSVGLVIAAWIVLTAITGGFRMILVDAWSAVSLAPLSASALHYIMQGPKPARDSTMRAAMRSHAFIGALSLTAAGMGMWLGVGQNSPVERSYWCYLAFAVGSAVLFASIRGVFTSKHTRSVERHSCDIPVLLDSDTGFVGQARMVDYSMGGALIEADFNAVPTRVTVTFGEGNTRIDMRVVRYNGHDCAVSIMRTPSNHYAWGQWVLSHSSQESNLGQPRRAVPAFKRLVDKQE